MPERMPVGDDVIHIGSSDFVSLGGAVEYGGPPEGAVGVHSEGSRSWSLRGLAIPGSPGIDELQVDPILPEINYSAAYPTNDGAHAWKGDIPDVTHIVTGLDPKEM